MKKRTLGQSGLEVSVITFGCWQAGGTSWTGTSDEASAAAMRAGYEAGINFFDTAEGYGGGHSEKLLGDFLTEVADDSVYVASKVGADNLSATGVRASCEQSLKLLGKEKIDLYQIHWPAGTWGSPIVPISETMGVLVELQSEGKIGAIGVSNFTAELITEASAFGRIDSLQPPCSLFFQPYIANGTVSYCDQNNIAVIPYSPLAQGLVTGKFTLDNRPDDNRSGNILFQDPVYDLAIQAVERLKPIAARYGVNTGQLALAWLIAQPGITSPIVGSRNAEQIIKIARAADLEISADDLKATGGIAQPVLDAQPGGRINPWQG